jgi:hypothetical protein
MNAAGIVKEKTSHIKAMRIDSPALILFAAVKYFCLS